MKLSTIVLYCGDADASREWYQSLGFPYLRGEHGMHWVGVGDVQLLLHPFDSPDLAVVPSLDVTVEDLDGLFAKARELGYGPHDHQQPGVELTGPVARPWGVRTFDLVDRDGYRWAFVQPV